MSKVTYTVDGLSIRGSPYLMEWLMAACSDGFPLRYGHIARLLEKKLHIERVFPTHVGHVAGALQERLWKYDADLPLINALVVNETGLPGSGVRDFLAKRFGERFRAYPTMSLQEQNKIAAKAMDEARLFARWPSVYRAVFGTRPARQPRSLFEEGELDGKTPEWGGTGESPEHKRLKEFVAANPQALGIKRGASKATCESRLLSGDEIDVRIDSRSYSALVEVKSRRSNYLDLVRGLYQCVKYRAVANAQLGPLESREIEAFLVTESMLPADLQKIAARLCIRHCVVRPT